MVNGGVNGWKWRGAMPDHLAAVYTTPDQSLASLPHPEDPEVKDKWIT